jgi:hypothetical protein
MIPRTVCNFVRKDKPEKKINVERQRHRRETNVLRRILKK